MPGVADRHLQQRHELCFRASDSYTASTGSPVYSFNYSRFGYGWRSEYDRFIVPNSTTPGSATAVDAIRADGNPVHFVWTGSAWYVAYWSSGSWSLSSDPRHDINIRIRTDGTYWYIIDASDTTDQYDATGKLLTITARNGYQQTLSYDSNNFNTVVSDSLGRQITFGYLPNGLANTVTDTAGNITHYGYLDRSGFTPPLTSGSTGLWVLQTVSFPDTTAITYLYTDPNPINRFALTGITDEDNNSYTAWTYDSTTGRALSSQHAGGADLTTISYDDVGNTRTVTNALGKQTIYSLTPFQGHFQVTSAAGQASTHTPASTVAYTYDGNGFVNQMTTGESRVTTYSHSALGQQTQENDGVGTSVARTINTTWDANYNVPDTVVQPNLTTSYTTPSLGGVLTQMVQTDTTSQTIPYSTNGQTRSWNYTYYSNGLLHVVAGPLGSLDTTTYFYNANGFVSSITDPLGHVTQITAWNVWGEPLTSIDPNNVTTSYTYDLRERLKSITVNPGTSQALTSFGYDNAGNPTGITLPDSSSYTLGYDPAHRLTSVTNNLGESITYTLDAMGDRKKTVIKSTTGSITKTSTATFDELTRMLKSIGAASQTTMFAYDKDNNQTKKTDPRSQIYKYAFDAIERLTGETDPDLFPTAVSYNGKDEVTGVIDARSLATSYVRDGFGDIIQQTSPDTGAATFWFDAHGNATKKIDARSVETDFTFDALDRELTRKIHGTTSENVTLTYDVLSSATYGIGRLRKIADPSGSTTFWYNQLGQITKDQRLIGAYTYTTSYVDDPAGHPLTVTYPSGRIVTYTRDALGRVSGITTKKNSGSTAVAVASSVGYEPFGPLAGLTFGNNLVLTASWDQDYQISGIVTAAGSTTIQNLAYSPDPAGNILSITDSLIPGRSQSFTYEDLNRLWTANGLYGAQIYTYDGVGNRKTATLAGTLSTYTTSTTSNQLDTIVTGSNTRSFGYLATGQASSDTRNPSTAYIYNYNDVGRLASASLNGTQVASYLYNGAEQRAVKTTSTSTTHYVFDRFGHLMAEADGTTGNIQREVIWLDNLPVALVDETGASPVLYFIHSDHLVSVRSGTPCAAGFGTQDRSYGSLLERR